MKKIETIRHSLSHLMAWAVQELYPAAPKGRASLNEIERGVKFGIGPAIENGFYYDFALPEDLSADLSAEARRAKAEALTKAEALAKEGLSSKDLPGIEAKMKKLMGQNVAFKKTLISKEKAKKIFKNQPFKLELLKELPGKSVSVYESGGFLDLCKGPHVKSTKEISPDSFKLTRVAGAYWKGQEKNPMLTRIYGVAFETKKELEAYFKIQEEAEKRDHRLLGQKLELFIFDEEVGAGLPLWMPRGEILRKVIEDYLYKELKKSGYQWVRTPHIGNLTLWKRSGHWNFYKENLYSPIQIEKEQYLLKPMNCPFHVKIYNSRVRSYKELPFYLAELGTVYRFERSGVLHGLTRVRGFTQDDAHLICQPNQIASEVTKLVKYGLKILKTFGFKDFNIYLSTRPETYTGSLKDWKMAENTLKYVMEKLKLKYQIDPGGGVFYGPKIDIKIKDSLGRDWQCTTIQFDFNLPEKLEMFYIDERGRKKRPYMVHRALLGSMERFIGVLLEYYGGALPLWLSPEQVWIIPVGSRHEKYAREIVKIFEGGEIRCVVKDENETVSKKIRNGEIQKIPYLLVVGDKEKKVKAVRVRQRGKGDIGMMKKEKFLKKIVEEIEKKR